jgi:hypothetical protein
VELTEELAEKFLAAQPFSVLLGGRQATCTCELSTIDGDGTATLCAVAQGTVIALRR